MQLPSSTPFKIKKHEKSTWNTRFQSAVSNNESDEEELMDNKKFIDNEELLENKEFVEENEMVEKRKFMESEEELMSDESDSNDFTSSPNKTLRLDNLKKKKLDSMSESEICHTPTSSGSAEMPKVLFSKKKKSK